MKHIAEALVMAALICCVAYCSIREDDQRHEEKMWCLNHGGKIDVWDGECKK